MNLNLIAILFILTIIFICIYLVLKYDYATKNYPLLITRPVYLDSQCLDTDGCKNFSAYTQKIKENKRSFGYGFSISLFFYIHNRNNLKSSLIVDPNNRDIAASVMPTPTPTLTMIKGDDFIDSSRNLIAITDQFAVKYLENESTLLFRFYYRNLDNSNFKQLKITDVTLQKWHHLGIVIDNRSVYIYYDNNLQLVQVLPYLPEIDVNLVEISECKNKIEVTQCDNPLTCTIGDKNVKITKKCTNAIDGQISLLQYFNDSINAKQISHIYNKYIRNPQAGNFWWL